MSLSDLCTNYITTNKLRDDTERNVIEFVEAPWGLGMGTIPGVPPLFPAQKFMLKAFYNIPPSKEGRNVIIKDRFNEKERFRFTEEEYLHFLYEEGRINVKEISGNPDDIRPNILLVVGRRGTKSSTISIISSFETYKLIKKVCPQEYYRILPEDEIWITCVATKEDQAAGLFRMITGHLERSDYFKKYRNKPTLNYMQLSTQKDIELFGSGMRPSLRIVASPCSARGLRGKNNIVAILDEMAYFFEGESSVDRSDETVYDAVTPSVAKFNSPEGEPHGKVICISSPAARSGKFFELYKRSMDPECNDLLMIQAPTWEVDYTLSPKYLRAKYSENPISFEAEFGANFSDRVKAWIDNEQILRLNIIPGLKLKELSYERVPHFMGIDIGLKNDGTAVAVCHIVKKEYEGGTKDFIELDFIDVRYAKDEGKEHFKPEEMAEWVYSISQKFFIVKGVMDQYYGLAIVPFLEDKGLKQIQSTHVSRDYASRTYQNLMSKMLDAGLRIPDGAERVEEGRKTTDLPLITEMLRLQATIHSKYLITVKAPDIAGLHDDLSDAFSRAVYLATEYMTEGVGMLKNKTASLVGPGLSYKRYARKHLKSSIYTNRPTVTQTSNSSRGMNLRSLSTLGVPFNRLGR